MLLSSIAPPPSPPPFLLSSKQTHLCWSIQNTCPTLLGFILLTNWTWQYKWVKANYQSSNIWSDSLVLMSPNISLCFERCTDRPAVSRLDDTTVRINICIPIRYRPCFRLGDTVYIHIAFSDILIGTPEALLTSVWNVDFWIDLLACAAGAWKSSGSVEETPCLYQTSVFYVSLKRVRASWRRVTAWNLTFIKNEAREHP